MIAADRRGFSILLVKKPTNVDVVFVFRNLSLDFSIINYPFGGGGGNTLCSRKSQRKNKSVCRLDYAPGKFR